jgi:hypothetical protein
MMKGERTPQYGDFIIDYNFRFSCYEVFGYKVDDFEYGFFKNHSEAVKYALDSGNTVWERNPGDRFTKITSYETEKTIQIGKKSDTYEMGR